LTPINKPFTVKKKENVEFINNFTQCVCKGYIDTHSLYTGESTPTTLKERLAPEIVHTMIKIFQAEIFLMILWIFHYYQ